MAENSDQSRGKFSLERGGARRRRGLATVAAAAIGGAQFLLAIHPLRADPPMSPPTCAMRLSLEVTPDVPDPTDGGFLSSLLGDHPTYQLFLLSRDDDTHVTLQLQGPGPAERCREVLTSMSHDGRVQSIQEN
jgi:hypothetical protein